MTTTILRALRKIDRERIKDIAAEQLRRGETFTGVQEKFSLRHRRDRKTIGPPLSYFVAKPQPWAPDLIEMANLEGAYMLFARMLGLPVAKSGSIYFADGTACFISRRPRFSTKPVKPTAGLISRSTSPAASVRGFGALALNCG